MKNVHGPRLTGSAVLGAVAILLITVLLGCANPVSNTPEEPSDETVAKSVSTNILEMPGLSASLPASLSTGSSVSSGSFSSMAVGDVSTVPQSDLEDIVGRGFRQLTNGVEKQYLLKDFSNELREIADEQELELDTIYDIGEREFMGGQYDLGNMEITGADSADFTVWWFAIPMPDFNFWLRMDITRNGDDWIIETWNTRRVPSTGYYGLEHAYFDSANQVSVKSHEYFNPGDDNPDGELYPASLMKSYNRAELDSAGALTVVHGERTEGYEADGSLNNTYTEESVAWGTDSYAGVFHITNDADAELVEEYYLPDLGLVRRLKSGQDQLPLKTLLPLQGAHEGDSVAKRETSDGSFEYFIDVSDGTDVPLSDVQDLSNVYTYDAQNDQLNEATAPVLTSTADSLPDYFTVPDQSWLGTVDNEVNAAYTSQLANVDLDSIPARDLKDVAEFDDLEF